MSLEKHLSEPLFLFITTYITLKEVQYKYIIGLTPNYVLSATRVTISLCCLLHINGEVPWSGRHMRWQV